MTISSLTVVAVAAMLRTSAAAAQSAPASAVPPDSEIRRILADRIDVQHQGIGMVVGVIEPKGRRVVAYGSLDKGDQRPLDGGTVFEIGSVTKVFTSLLLAAMVERGEVALADPVAKFLPEGVKVPERGGRQITLQDLSMHVSGLPRIPLDLMPVDAANPFADYTADKLYHYVSAYVLTRDIGSQWEYSNLGAGLLGHALERRAGTDYESLVRARIAGPLGMESTRITLSPEMKARLAVGHNAALTPVKNWDFQVLAGCGALRSDANDLLTFLAANLGYKESPLAPAMAAMLKVRRPAAGPMQMALGWLVTGSGIVWHNGGTYGYRTFVGYNPKTRAGVVVLSNTFTMVGVDDIGLHLLGVGMALWQPPEEHKEVSVDPKRAK